MLLDLTMVELARGVFTRNAYKHRYNDVVASGTQPVAYRYIIVFAVYSMCAPRH
jgi:hypothetical protein